jgi:hypothetical protein
VSRLIAAVRYLLEHQAALTIAVLTSVLTYLIGKLGLDLDGSAIALAIIAQLSAGLGIRQAVYSKATATTIAENAYVEGVLTPTPPMPEGEGVIPRIVVPDSVKP